MRPTLNRRSLLSVVAVLCMAQLLRVVLFDLVAPDFTRGGRPFLLADIPAGSTLSQRLEALDDGLSSVSIDALVQGSGRGRLEVGLFEAANGGELEVRTGSIDLSPQTDACCTLRFAPLEASRARRYRLDVKTRELDESLRFAARATPVRDDGALAVNGRPQAANLVLRAEGTPLARLKGEGRLNLALLLALFTVMDAAIAYVVYSWWRGEAAGGA